MKIMLSTIALSAIFLASCSPKKNIDIDKEASKEFVQAALQLDDAKKTLENFEFANAQKEFVKISNNIDEIIRKYPSSRIALKLVSEDNVRIGTFKYDSLKKKIIPILEQLNTPEIKPIVRTWAIASFDSKSEQAFKVIANDVENYGSFSNEIKKGIIEQIPFAIELKSSKTAKKLQIKSYKNIEIKKNELSEIEVNLLLKEAEKNAKYCAYELSASEELLKKAEKIDVKKYPKFSKILRAGLEKAKQISVLKLREKSYATLAAAAAKANDESLALEIMSLIKNPEAFENVFKSIADSLGKTKNYPAALSIASKINNLEIKNDFLARLVNNIAMQGKILHAIEISKQIKSLAIKNKALCNIAIIAYEAKDFSNFVVAISNIDISNLDCLNAFTKYASTDIKNNPTTSGAIATLAKMVIPTNPKMGEILNDLSAKNEKINYAAAETIVENFVAVNRFDKVESFVQSNVDTIKNADLLIAKAVVLGANKNKSKAMEILKRLAKKTKNNDILKQVAFAFIVETSLLSETEKTEVLKPLFKLM